MLFSKNYLDLELCKLQQLKGKVKKILINLTKKAAR